MTSEVWAASPSSTRSIAVGTLVLAAWCFLASASHAQFAGQNFRGDFGLFSGTQPDPGFYLSPMYLRYDGDRLRDEDGRSVGIDPQRRGSIDANAYVLGMLYTTDWKLLGANVGFTIFPSFTDNVLEVPILGTVDRTSTGFGDLYFQPLTLGWRTARADFIAGLGVYAPTGEYEAFGEENRGLGMWGFELSAGTTLYLDSKRSWHLATAAFYEIHTRKDGIDVRVGDLLTLEGGLGKSFLDGALTVGLAYYAQWKVTRDEVGAGVAPRAGGSLPRHRVFGVGPELTIPIATRSKLYGLINIRYLWETGARSTLEGQTLAVTISVPIPSIAL